MSSNKFYDEYWNRRAKSLAGWDERRFQQVLGPLVGCQRVLDYGCGVGHKYRALLVKAVGEYAGADVSALALDTVRAGGHAAYPINSSDSTVAAPDQSFDGAVCSEVFEHLFDPLAAAREIHRVLKPGAAFVVTVPNFGYHTWRLMALLRARVPSEPEDPKANPFNGVHIRYFSTFSLRRLLVMAGFENVRIGSYMDGSIWDVFQIGGPLSRISAMADRFLPPLLHLRFLQDLAPSVFAIRIRAVCYKRQALRAVIS